MAAAIGADLPVEEPTGSMVIDIGGGTTEVAVIAMGGIVVSQSIRIAGDEFDQAILTHVRDAYNLAIGERTAEDIKIKVGSAVPLKDELDVEVNGRDVITGLPKTVRIESEEIRRALNKPLDEMAKAVKDALDATPPDLASDLMYYGILLTGGGALLRGLDVRLRDETGVSVNVSPTALDNVVNGCARVLEANAFDGGFVQTNANSKRWIPFGTIFGFLHKSEYQATINGYAPVDCFSLISVLLLTFYIREGEAGPIHAVRSGVTTITSPVRFVGSAVAAPFNAIGNVFSNLTAYAGHARRAQEAKRGTDL